MLESKDPGLSPGQVIVLHYKAKHFLAVPLSSQEYKKEPVNIQGCLMICVVVALHHEM